MNRLVDRLAYLLQVACLRSPSGENAQESGPDLVFERIDVVTPVTRAYDRGDERFTKPLGSDLDRCVGSRIRPNVLHFTPTISGEVR